MMISPKILFLGLILFNSIMALPRDRYSQPPSNRLSAEADEMASLKGHWAKGPSYTVAVGRNGHIYFGDGAELVCASLGTDGQISESGRVVLPDVPRDIELSDSGDWAYVAVGYQGIAVVDVSMPTSPRLVHTLSGAENGLEALGISKSGDHLFVAAGGQGLWQATVFKPDSIVWGSAYKESNSIVNDVAARNDSLFIVSSGRALEMLLYSDEGFRLMKQVNYNLYTENYGSQTPYGSALIWRSDSLFVADSWSGLFFFTVHDTVISFSGMAKGACNELAVRGNHVFTTDYYNVNMFEMNNGRPVYQNYVALSTSMGVAAWQDFLIVAGKSSGIYSYDVSDPSNWVEKSFFATHSLSYDLFQQKYYIYRITPVNGLDIIAVHDPANPHRVAHLDLNSGNEEGQKVFVSGDTAFVYARNITTNASILYLVDVGDPTAPELISSWTYPSTDRSFTDIAVSGKFIYAAINSDVVIIDFSDISNIHETGRASTSGWIEDLAVKDGFVYTAGEDQGMSVVDVSDPNHPLEKAVFRESDMDYYTQIVVRGNHAYVADSWIGLKIIDISNPTDPVLAGSYNGNGSDFYASPLAVSGNYAYVQANWGEVLFINISDPAHPILKGRYNAPSVAGLTSYSRMVFIAGSSTGIYAVSNDNNDALLPCHFAGEVSGEWNCPTIYLEDDILIPVGDTLRIGKDVQKVFALGAYQIRVEGVLIATGPENDNITLSDNYLLFSGNSWHGLYFKNGNDHPGGTSLLENCRFDNSDKRDMDYQGGGAVAIYNSDNVIIRNSVFYHNVARLGGAIYIEQASPRIENSYFELNGRGGVNNSEVTTEGGGALYIRNAHPYLHRLRFAKNGAQSGGALVIDGCSPILSNILFEDNISSGLGGAVAITSDLSHPARPRFVNITVAGNQAFSGGGAMQLMGPETTPEIINSILYGNSKPEIYINDGLPVVSYSIVDSASTEEWFGEGCLDDDPLFDEHATIDYHLRSTSCGSGIESPGIDAGHPDSTDSWLDCSAGLGGTRADMGYYGGRYGDLVTSLQGGAYCNTPVIFSLRQNYPNPFNPLTLIRYSLDKETTVRLVVYNALGQKVKTLVRQRQKAGWHQVGFNGIGLSSGVYYYRLSTAEGRAQTGKMVLLR